MITGKATLEGLQRAQASNLKTMQLLMPRGYYGQMTYEVATQVHRHTVALTHVDTGALRASHRLTVRGLEAEVYLDPGATNPRTGAKTSVYGEVEHERGGDHAFYQRVIDEKSPEIIKNAIRGLESVMRSTFEM